MDCSYVSQADHNCGSCTELARINSLFFAWKPAFIYTTKWPDTHSSLHLAIWVSRAGLKLKFWRRDRYNTTQNTVHSIYVCTIELWLVTYAPCISAHITSSISRAGAKNKDTAQDKEFHQPSSQPQLATYVVLHTTLHATRTQTMLWFLTYAP